MEEEPKKLKGQDGMASAHLQERREVRYEVPIEVEISGLDRTGQVFRERTFTKDVSEWGCGFTSSVELKVDDIVAVSLVAPGTTEPDSPPASLFQVVRVSPKEGGWLVGAWKMNREKMWGAYLEKIAAQTQSSRKWREETGVGRSETIGRDKER
jgi:hypothetical protein